MPAAGPIATALLGVGVTLASTFADSLGLSVEQQRIGFGLGVALMAAGVVLYLYEQRRNKPAKPPPGKIINSKAGGDSLVAGRDIIQYNAPSAVQEPGDLARKARERGGQRPQEPPLHRAIANGIAELERVRTQLVRAEETGHLRTKTPDQWQASLDNLLTDKGRHSSRTLVDNAYGASEDFWERLHVSSREHEGPFGDWIEPTITESDNLLLVLAKVDEATAELRKLQGGDDGPTKLVPPPPPEETEQNPEKAATREDPPSAAHDLADLYKEGDKLRVEGLPPEGLAFVQRVLWNGGDPQKARDWDAAVSGYLFERSQ